MPDESTLQRLRRVREWTGTAHFGQKYEIHEPLSDSSIDYGVAVDFRLNQDRSATAYAARGDGVAQGHVVSDQIRTDVEGDVWQHIKRRGSVSVTVPVTLLWGPGDDMITFTIRPVVVPVEEIWTERGKDYISHQTYEDGLGRFIPVPKDKLDVAIDDSYTGEPHAFERLTLTPSAYNNDPGPEGPSQGDPDPEGAHGQTTLECLVYWLLVDSFAGQAKDAAFTGVANLFAVAGAGIVDIVVTPFRPLPGFDPGFVTGQVQGIFNARWQEIWNHFSEHPSKAFVPSCGK